MRKTAERAGEDPLPQLTVFHDGACPLCQREIAFLRRRAGSDRIEWVDVSASPDGEVFPGVQKDEALRRFHVSTADGRVLSGAAAFAAIWSTLPAIAWLGRVASHPRVTPVLEWLYVRFLKVRPRLQKLVPARRGAELEDCDRNGRQTTCSPESRRTT